MKKRIHIVSMMLLLVFLNTNTVLPNTIQVYSREGVDVSNSTWVSSDHIHIVVPGYSQLSSAQYKIFEGAEKPSSWGGIPSYDFHKELFFYKKNVNQHIRISISDGSGTANKVISLQGGVLTAHVDDPIPPHEYVQMMGTAGLIVEGDDYQNVSPEEAVPAIKKAGISHVRIHIGRLNKSKNGENSPTSSSTYFKNLDRWVNEICRHGLVCHLGNKTNSVTELSIDPKTNYSAFYPAFTSEMEAWWNSVADRYKYASHRFSYHIYLESGGKDLFKKGNQAQLNAHYARMTEVIRLHDATRNIIYPPGGINDPNRLNELEFPYPDLNPSDGITTGSGIYFFADFHKGFAGGGWHPGETVYEQNLTAATNWSKSNNIPLLFSACNVKDRVAYPTVKRVEEIKILMNRLSTANAGNKPIPVTFLTLNDFYTYGEGWVEDFFYRARFEALNGDASIDPNDHDADRLPNDDEINIYGTDPYNSDTDMDNISDFAEVTLPGLDPNNPMDGTSGSDLSISADFDGDGISNAKELEYSVYDVKNLSTSQPILNIDNPNDSEESYRGDIPNVWEFILGFNIDDDKTFLPQGLDGSSNYDDNTYDHDEDGISTLDEVKNYTWPRTHDEKKGDQDYDFNVVGLDDTMPYIHDSCYIVGYEFTAISNNKISNQARQGSTNTGTLIGKDLSTNGVMFFDESNLITIPATDFLTLHRRSIHFHFVAGNVNSEQVLYAEGDASNGLSIAVSNGKIVTSTWSNQSGIMQEAYLNESIHSNKWYAVTVTFDGDRQEFKLSLYNANRPINRIKTALPFSSVTLPESSTVTLGGTQGTTRLYSTVKQAFSTVNKSPFYGYIDDFHIYNRVLSETDISLLSRNDLYPQKDLRMPLLPNDDLEDNSTTNLVPNADFEEGETGWSANGAEARSLVQPGHDNSINAYQITGALNKGTQYQLNEPLLINPQEYTMALWAKGTAGEKCKMKVKYNDGSFSVFSMTFSSTDTWEYFSEKIKPAASATAVDKFLVQCGSDLSPSFQTFTIDDLYFGPVIQTSAKNDIKEQEFKVFPNPAHHAIHVVASVNIEKVEIYNLSGVKLMEGTNVGSLPKGIYLVVATINGKRITQKLHKI